MCKAFWLRVLMFAFRRWLKAAGYTDVSIDLIGRLGPPSPDTSLGITTATVQYVVEVSAAYDDCVIRVFATEKETRDFLAAHPDPRKDHPWKHETVAGYGEWDADTILGYGVTRVIGNRPDAYRLFACSDRIDPHDPLF